MTPPLPNTEGATQSCGAGGGHSSSEFETPALFKREGLGGGSKFETGVTGHCSC